MDVNQTGLVLRETSYVPAVALTPEQARDNFLRLQEIIKAVMREGVDYGTLPGTDKPTLLKPGAEHMMQFFGFSHELVKTDSILEWDKGFFFFDYRCDVLKYDYLPDGTLQKRVIASCHGSANSKEARYAYRWLTEKKLPAGINKNALEKRQKSGKYGLYTEYKVTNEDIFTLVNTLQKMAQKRAMVGAALQATGASGLFTQDMEDIVDAEVTVEQPSEKAETAGTPPPASTPNQTSEQGSTDKAPSWTGFWAECRKMKIDQNAIHKAYAPVYLGVGEVKSLTDHIKTQGELDAFLAYVKAAGQKPLV